LYEMPKTPKPPRRNIADEPGELVEFPGMHEPTSPRNNLPLQLSSMVGRDRERKEAGRLLADRRLLTLTGPGGSGKTRLALAVAGDVAGGFEDGVWWVALASLSDRELVAQAVASVLGAREQPGRSLGETLADHLASRETLLILDNCEHLVDACARLADALLRSCPNLRVLSTSREALGVAGEMVLLVPPLSLPDPGHLPPPEELERYEAVRLFVERARYATSSFELTARNASAVARLCSNLDGIPLAIELAAARTKVLSVAQISSRLAENFRLLRSKSHTADPRQQTLAATLEWSHELLSEPERVLFCRLSVFAGGFTLEAAERVCAGGDIGEDDVLDLLSRLIDKSLVLTDEHLGEVRYRLLETVRQYGREKLEELGEAGEVRHRHAAWFLALAERAEPELKRRQQVVWLARLEKEHDNLRAAMRWLLREGDTETAVRFAWVLWLFWWYHGYQGEGRRYAEEMLEKANFLPADVRARAIYVRAAVSYGLESMDLTMRLCEESAVLFRQVGDGPGLAVTLGVRGITALQQGHVELARSSFEEGLEIFREMDDKWGIVSTLAHLGIIPFGAGDNAGATRYFEEAVALSHDIGGRIPAAYISLYNLALIARSEGDDGRASGLYVEGLNLAVEVGDKANVAYCLEGLAGLIGHHGEPERAVRLYGASEALLESVGAPLYVHAQDRAIYEKAVETLRSRLGEDAFQAAWAEGRVMTSEQAVDYALQDMATPTEEPPQHADYPAGLSAREVDVLKLVAQGLTNARIAKELFISPNTVNRHLNSVYHKLGVSSRAAATHFAAEHNLA
jgi:predicted ATPase/DNA-binding CsgD family transcriptional regulator